MQTFYNNLYVFNHFISGRPPPKLRSNLEEILNNIELHSPGCLILDDLDEIAPHVDTDRECTPDDAFNNSIADRKAHNMTDSIIGSFKFNEGS